MGLGVPPWAGLVVAAAGSPLDAFFQVLIGSFAACSVPESPVPQEPRCLEEPESGEEEDAVIESIRGEVEVDCIRPSENKRNGKSYVVHTYNTCGVIFLKMAVTGYTQPALYKGLVGHTCVPHGAGKNGFVASRDYLLTRIRPVLPQPGNLVELRPLERARK